MMFTMIANYISLSTMYILDVYTLPRLTATDYVSFMLPISEKVNKRKGGGWGSAMKTIEGRYEDIQRAVYLCDLMLRLSVRLILVPERKNKMF